MINPLILTLSLTQPLQFSEIRLDSAGINDVEYIELSGTPNESLEGKSILVLDHEGRLNGIVPLAYSIPEDGYYLIGNSFGLLEQPDHPTNTYMYDQDNVTLFLIDTVPQIVQGYDLDDDDDGVLDQIEWNVIDSIQFKHMSGPTYSPNVIQGNGIYVWGAERCLDNAELWKQIPKQYPTNLDSPGEENEICDGTVTYCFGDIDQDGNINGNDLSVLIGSWGTDNESCDLNDDGIVNIEDLSLLLGVWGIECE